MCIKIYKDISMKICKYIEIKSKNMYVKIKNNIQKTESTKICKMYKKCIQKNIFDIFFLICV